MSSKKRVRSNSDESGVDSVEAKKILLDILDDSDLNPVSQDLDSFMKTFEDEISPAPESTQLTQLPTESQPELGFLLEASDDELGLPPTESKITSELADSFELSELWGLDDQIASYGFEYEYGYDEDVNNNNNGINNNGEYLALDGLFDHTDVGFGASDLTWQTETLPAQ